MKKDGGEKKGVEEEVIKSRPEKRINDGNKTETKQKGKNGGQENGRGGGKKLNEKNQKRMGQCKKKREEWEKERKLTKSK